MAEYANVPRNQARRSVPPWWMGAAFALILASLVAGGYYLYSSLHRAAGKGGKPAATESAAGNNENNQNKDMSNLLHTGAPNRLVRDDGAYELIAVIDGAGANKQFIANLQVINGQRQGLGELRSKIASLPKSAAASEKAGLESKAKEIEGRLTSNMEFMAKNYGYSVSRNYILMPLQANLLEKAKDEEGKFIEDESRATLVKTLGSTEEYDAFELLRRQHVEALQKKEKGQGTAKEAEALGKRLVDEFGFKAGGNYALQITKGALYAKVQ